MSICSLSRVVLLLTLVALIMPGASGWTFTNWSVSPGGSNLPPGTPVSAGYSIHFDSWTTGRTFENDNSLVMYTDLVDPHWTVTKVEAMDGQEPIVEPVPVRQSAMVKLDGWTLCYASKRFDAQVLLTGKTPAPNSSATITLVKVQEMEPGSKAISGSLIKKEAQVIIPTQEPTPVLTAPVTINMTPAEFIEITAEQTTPATTSASTVRQTYSPGPGPVGIVSLLAGLVLLMQVMTRRE